MGFTKGTDGAFGDMTDQEVMNPKLELRKKWIEALRSGRYEQGQGKLKGLGGYCCLGIAAELAGEVFRPSTGCPGAWYIPGDHVQSIMISMLPDRIVKAYGLRNAVGSFLEPTPDPLVSHRITSLSHMNDSPRTFAEIADFIEQHPEQVFVEDS